MCVNLLVLKVFVLEGSGGGIRIGRRKAGGGPQGASREECPASLSQPAASPLQDRGLDSPAAAAARNSLMRDTQTVPGGLVYSAESEHPRWTF